jgi:phenylacetate-CoA ligase
MPALSVLVPCLNEAANLPELVARVRGTLRGPPLAAAGAELILIDDGSQDDTWPRMARLADEFPDVRAVRHAHTLGIPAAWRTGLGAARGDRVCVLDADLQYDPDEIARLWRELHDSGADIAQGTRGRAARAHDLRFVFSRGLCGVLNLTFRMSLADNKSGFFLCRREVLADLLDYRGHFRHWQCFVMVAAHHRGYRIRQIDTPFAPRRAGRSAFGALPLASAAAVALDLLPALREYPPVRP